MSVCLDYNTHLHSKYLPLGFTSCLLDKERAKATHHLQETMRHPISPLSIPTVLSSLGRQDPSEGRTLNNKLIKPPRMGATSTLCPLNSTQQADLILEKFCRRGIMVISRTQPSYTPQRRLTETLTGVIILN